MNIITTPTYRNTTSTRIASGFRLLGNGDQRLDLLFELQHFVLAVGLDDERHAERKVIAQPLVHAQDGVDTVDGHEIIEHQHDGDHHRQ